MLADAVVYGLNLYAVGRTVQLQKRAAKFSGILKFVLALWVLVEVLRRFILGSDPEPLYMVGVATVALIANVTCLVLLSKHRAGGVHMKASWIFSANDVIANIGVILAGILVAVTSSRLPDLIIGLIICVVVLRGAIKIMKISR